eukprot:scaffold2974_cov181-Amphora_coffeaeformis.AAC.9
MDENDSLSFLLQRGIDDSTETASANVGKPRESTDASFPRNVPESRGHKFNNQIERLFSTLFAFCDGSHLGRRGILTDREIVFDRFFAFCDGSHLGGGGISTDLLLEHTSLRSILEFDGMKQSASHNINHAIKTQEKKKKIVFAMAKSNDAKTIRAENTGTNVKTEKKTKAEKVGTKAKANWQTRFEECKAFAEKTGHCKIPTAYKDNKSLGIFVQEMRRNYKLIKQGKASRFKMSDEQIAQLDSIGFHWGYTPDPNGSAESDASWEANFEALEDFKKEHGNFDVPMEGSMSTLATWTRAQRNQKYRRDSKLKCFINKKRIDKLAAIDFDWDGERKRCLVVEGLCRLHERGILSVRRILYCKAKRATFSSLRRRHFFQHFVNAGIPTSFVATVTVSLRLVRLHDTRRGTLEHRLIGTGLRNLLFEFSVLCQGLFKAFPSVVINGHIEAPIGGCH